MNPHLDPDPLDVTDLDDGAWMFERERAYYDYLDRKPGIFRSWTPLLVAVLIVIIAAVFVVQVATPRTGQGPASTAPALSGVPQRVVNARSQPVRAGSAAPLPDTSTAVSGTASWYCGGGSACTRGYPEGTLAAAAGPALRVGDWRGRIVKVCNVGGDRKTLCVKVILADFCACPRRVIDLYRSAFSRLASPSRGVLRVSVTWGGTAIGLPPTDTEGSR